MTSWRSAVRVSYVPMHCFADSLLELIPKIVFVETRATRTGFICDVITPSPITEAHLTVALQRTSEKVAKGDIFHINEMIPSNAADFLRSRKQVLRSKMIDREEEFVTVFFNETYANFGEDVEIGPFFVENEGTIDTAHFHGKEVAVTRLRGIKKEFQKKLKGARDHQSIKDFFRFEKDQIVWSDAGLKKREQLVNQVCALFEGYQRVHRPFSDVPPSVGEFDIVEVEGDPNGEFGLKDRFSHLLVRVSTRGHTSLLHLLDKLCKIFGLLYQDDLGLSWDIVENEDGLIKIWVDRLFAMTLEKELDTLK